MIRRHFASLCLVAAVATLATGCAKPWYGFEWMSTAPSEGDPEDDAERIGKMRSGDPGDWSTGASSRSREIEARLGYR